MESLELTVNLAPALATPGMRVGVVYRRWDGAPIERLAVAAEPGTSMVVPEPEVEVRTELPVELGGPWSFALGYLVVIDPTLSAERDTTDPLKAIRFAAPDRRVLWTSGPFPAEAFARMASDPSLSPAEVAALADQLAAFLPGLMLARTTLRRRSLVGFERLDTATLELGLVDSGAWPPTWF